MIPNCNSNIPINLTVDSCDGKRTPTECLIHSNALSFLELGADSTQYQINEALVLALQSAIDRIELLEYQIQNHETRITNLE